MYTNLSVTQRHVGVNYIDQGTKAAIRIWAPFASQLNLIIPEAKQTLALFEEPMGYWYLETNELPEHTDYLLEIHHNGDVITRPDPASLCQPHGVHEPSQSFNLQKFEFQDEGWKGIPLNETILYELHLGTFSPQGDTEGLIEKLDYLIDLGINTIELMPVSAFSGTRNWGYDGVYPFAVQHEYGGPENLQKLVNVCHQKGIAVILDVVYNHLGPEGNYLGDFGPYFNKEYQTAWGPALNFESEYSPAVRNFFLDNAIMWLRDFHIDGLRLDAVHAIKDHSAVPLLKELKHLVDELSQHTQRSYHLIVECDLNDPKYLEKIAHNGFGMDAHWNDDFHHSLRIAVGEPKKSYYAAYQGLSDLAKSYTQAYVYDGCYSAVRRMYIGDKPSKIESKQFVVFSQNHDQIGNRMLGERVHELYGIENQKLMAGAVFISPFIPQLFMGEEWASPSRFQYFVDHQDPELIDQVRKGRQSEFNHEGEAPDPFAQATFEDSRLKWDALEQAANQQLFKFYKTLIEFRKDFTPFKTIERHEYQVEVQDAQSVLTITFGDQEQSLFAVLNFSNVQQSVELPSEKHWQLRLNSADLQFGGPQLPTNNPNNDTLSPHSIKIFIA